MEVVLTIDNSTCSLTGLSPDQFATVRDRLSYTEAKRTFRGFQSVKKHLMSKRGDFPSGLLYLVEDYLEANRIRHHKLQKRTRPQTQRSDFPKANFGTVTPYPEQYEAAQAALEHGRGIVVAPTGVGKSFIAALILAAFGVTALVVVPSLELKTQLTAGLRSIFGASHVGPLGRDGTVRNAITVENVDALPSKKPLKGVDLVIVDEFHRSGAKTYRDLNKYAWSTVFFKIGLTATPFRSKDEERLLLESVLSKVIYRIDYSTAVAKGYIVPLEAYYFDLPKVDLKCNGRSWAGVYAELIVKRADRNALIAFLTGNLVSAGISTLVLTKQVEHGERLQELLALDGHDVPFAQGENENNRQLILEFCLREKLGLIGTVGVLGEGIDTRPAEWVLLSGGGKSKNQTMQNIGRIFRKFPGKETGKVVLFRDESHKWLLDHFKAQCKILKDEYGITPVRLDLPEYV